MVQMAPLTAIVLTYDEEANIARTLGQLGWITRVIVVDSGSKDRTVEIANSFQNVELFTRQFDCHTNQWNFALAETGIDSEWVLAIDADYYIPEELAEEIRSTVSADNAGFDGYWMRFEYAIEGQRLRSGIYPAVIALYRRSLGDYVSDGHTQRLRLDGQAGWLKNRALHDDRKPVSRWLQSQWRYAELEAQKLTESPWGKLSINDRIRCGLMLSPIIVFFYCWFGRLGVLDGRAGIVYAFERTLAEILIQFSLFKSRSRVR